LHGLGGGPFRQRFDHPALANLAMPAGIERAPQFAAQGGQLSNAAVNVRDMAPGDAVHLGAGTVGLLALSHLARRGSTAAPYRLPKPLNLLNLGPTVR
jgi:NADPH-dependent 2,4-dienoyl-CoA reductase/sulfur reductase-like enzyme